MDINRNVVITLNCLCSVTLFYLFYENGLIYISSKYAILNLNNYISEDVFPYVTSEIGSMIDIDFESDLKFAELILKNQDYLWRMIIK